MQKANLQAIFSLGFVNLHVIAKDICDLNPTLIPNIYASQHND